MVQSRPRESKLWEYINRTHITEEKIQDLTNFKSDSINHKLSIWNPRTNGVRYLKELIFYICTTLSSREWDKLTKIHKKETGGPYSIRYNNETVCLDYLQAVLEITIIEDDFDFQDASVIEIGAGYGRTCHAVLSNYDIDQYTIIELKNALEVAKRYLKIVLDKKRYKKITFVDVDHFDDTKSQQYDLCINIDSFSEMDEDTVRLYLKFINEQCGILFVKNPVGKYMDKSLDTHSEGNEVVKMALTTGLLRDIIDIHDNREVARQAQKFIRAYCPSIKWECVKHGWAKPWSFYWQAIYRKKGDSW